MGFKGSKKKILTATLGSFLLFQQPLMTVVSAAEMLDDKHSAEKVHQKETNETQIGDNKQAKTKETSSIKSSETEQNNDSKIQVRNQSNTIENCSSLKEALSKVENNGTIVLSGNLTIDEAIKVDKKNIHLVAEEGKTATIKKQKADMSMIQVTDGSTVTVSGHLTFDGQFMNNGTAVDSNHALVQVDKGGHFIMEKDVTLTNARCGWKDFATINNAGTVDMKGGSITNAYASRNSGVFVAKDATFNMSGGKIAKGYVSHTNAAVGVQGTFNMTGGDITENSTSWENGGVALYAGGRMNFDGGHIYGNTSKNKSGITLDEGSHLQLGEKANLSDELLLLGNSTKVEVKSEKLAAYSVKEPLKVQVGNSEAGRVLFDFDNEKAASAARTIIQVKNKDNGTKLPLVVNPKNKKQLEISSEEQRKDIEILDNPYTDSLGLNFKEKLTTQEGRQQLKDAIEALYGDSKDGKEYNERLAYLEKQYEYVSNHRKEIEASVQTLSELGDPGAEQARTQQSYPFDNLDATGFYLKPGQVNKINVYVESQDPSKVYLTSRQAGTTENNGYHSLDKHTHRLKNGWNQLTVDLTNNKYGEMVYFQNNSKENPTKVRVEGVEANETNTIEGKSLGRHSMFIYDGKNADQFKQYLDDVNQQVAAVDKTKNDAEVKDRVQDMTFIQVGTTQLAMRASLMKNIAATEKLTNESAAAQYVKNLNKYMKERIDYFWKYAGFSEKETGVNAISPMRLYVAFTSNVTSPSTMYAFVSYYHMPESTANAFMNGSALYGWGMSHEYGHMLDNRVLVVGEQTNNMYSLWGARNQGIKNFKEKGENTFDVEKSNTVYHGEMRKAYNELNTYLSQVARGENPEGAFMKGGHFFKVMPWFLGTHYFDDWDYSQYDFAASPYTKEIADQVKEFGAYGAALRLMRSTDAREKVESLSSNHYYRMVAAFTMATGYNFAEYMEAVGETDIPDNVKAFCKQYPSMPRKVQYYSLNADGKQIMGYKPYSGRVEPTVEVKQEKGKDILVTKMANEDQEKATIAYELYKDGKLVDFSRTGKFEVPNAADSKDQYAVKTYDFRLTPSQLSNDQSSLKVKDVTITEGSDWNNKEAFVSATDELGKEVDFSQVKVEGKVDTTKPGTYKLSFEYAGQKAVATITVKAKEKAEPVYHATDRYAAVVKDDYSLWNDLDFDKERGNTKSIYQQTVRVKAYYTHPNGSTYASLYNDKDQWLGYVNQDAIEYQDTPGGKYYSVQRYAAVVKDNYTLWRDFDFSSQKGETKSLYKQTVYVKGEYHHFNGSTYASLYNDKDQWLGYVNQDAIEYQDTPGGKYYSVQRYAAVVKDNYTLWRDFDFSSQKGETKSLYKQTVYVKGEYHHFNGSTYASLYNDKDQWLGYVNQDAIEYQDTPGGKYYSVQRYAAVVKDNYTLWRDFDFSSQKGETKSLYKQTVYVKGEYHHFNGSTYASLYNDKDQWLGYVNQDAIEYQDTPGGKYYSVQRYATVVKDNYTLWRDFDFSSQKGETKSLYKQTVYVKGEYHHFNGSTYASLYNDKDQWLGYVNQDAIKFK